MENKDWRDEAREEWHVRTFNMANEVSDYSKVEMLIADWWIEKLQQALAEDRERMRGETERIVLVDAMVKFNSTPEVFEPFNIEKHNHTNKMLNDMNRYIYDALISSLDKPLTDKDKDI